MGLCRRERGWSGGLQDVSADARDELPEQLGRAERCRAHFADAVVLKRRRARHEEHVRHEALALACGKAIWD